MFSSIVNGAFNIGQQTAANEFSREQQENAIRANKESQERSIAANERAAELAYLRSLSFYQQYNSPEAIVKQLKKAGLSVGMMYSGGGSGQGHGEIQSPAMANPNSNNPAIAGMGIGTGGEMSLVDMAQARKLNAEADLVEKYGGQEKESNINLQNAKAATEESLQKMNEALKGKAEKEAEWQGWQAKIAEIDKKIKAASEQDLIEYNKEKVKELQAAIEWYDQQVKASKAHVQNEGVLTLDMASYYYNNAMVALQEMREKLVKNTQLFDTYDAVVAEVWAGARKAAAEADNEEKFMERFNAEMRQRRRDNMFELGEAALNTVGTVVTEYMGGRFKLKALRGTMAPTFHQTTTQKIGNKTVTQSWTRRGM